MKNSFEYEWTFEPANHLIDKKVDTAALILFLGLSKIISQVMFASAHKI